MDLQQRAQDITMRLLLANDLSAVMAVGCAAEIFEAAIALNRKLTAERMFFWMANQDGSAQA